MKKKKLKRELVKEQNQRRVLVDYVQKLEKENEELRMKNSDLQEENGEMIANCKSMEESLRCMYTVVELLKEQRTETTHLEPKQVIRSEKDGTTIVLWKDGVKTKVKVGKNDTYNPVAGLAVAYLKRMLVPETYRKVFVNNDVNVVDQDAVRAVKKAKSDEPSKEED